MNTLEISKDTEEKRLRDFKRIAENWDNIPEYARGKLAGTIETIASVCLTDESKKAG
ncbi:hypothetical protein AALB12_12255 [Blautia coccoides]|uniref:hypothetical protein n=1 Tax=Blautia producta TaxID=33035 RepID=UPI003512B29A